MPENALLAQYRREGAAGTSRRVQDQGSVAYSLREHTNPYGPSHAHYESWKKSGIPTKEVLQSKTFGISTIKSGTAGEALAFTPSAPEPAQPMKQYHMEAMNRTNPITWMGGPPDQSRPLLSSYANAAADAARREMPQPLQAPPAPPPDMPPAPATGGPLSPKEMQQTWSELLRTRKHKPSAAQSLIQMPPEFSTEAPPRAPHIASQSLMTIGLHDDKNRMVKRSSAFTSDFRDPFL